MNNYTDLAEKVFSDITPLTKPQLKEKNIFPTYGLPSVIKNYAQNISTVYGVPIQMAAMPMFVAFGSIIGKKFWLETGKYKNYAQFFLVINTPSGVGKSEPCKRAMKPLQIIDRVNFDAYKSELFDWKAKCKLCKSHKPPLEEPKKPNFKQLILDDATPEALCDILYNNNSTATIFTEELSGWFANFGRYNKSSEAQSYLCYFDNTDKVINRKDDIKLIKEPFLNIIGTIQPSVLQSTISSPAMQENGLSSRFLYVTCLDVVRQYKNDLAPDKLLADNYQYIVNHLSNLSITYGLQLSNEAKELYRNFGDYLTDIIRGSKNAFLNSSLSKMEIHCLRLALLVQVVKSTEPNKSMDLVEVDTMQYAIDLCHYFIGNIPLPSNTELVKMEDKTAKVLEMLKAGKLQKDIAMELKVSQPYISTIKKKYKLN